MDRNHFVQFWRDTHPRSRPHSARSSPPSSSSSSSVSPPLLLPSPFLSTLPDTTLPTSATLTVEERGLALAGLDRRYRELASSHPHSHGLSRSHLPATRRREFLSHVSSSRSRVPSKSSHRPPLHSPRSSTSPVSSLEISTECDGVVSSTLEEEPRVVSSTPTEPGTIEIEMEMDSSVSVPPTPTTPQSAERSDLGRHGGGSILCIRSPPRRSPDSFRGLLLSSSVPGDVGRRLVEERDHVEGDDRWTEGESQGVETSERETQCDGGWDPLSSSSSPFPLGVTPDCSLVYDEPEYDGDDDDGKHEPVVFLSSEVMEIVASKLSTPSTTVYTPHTNVSSTYFTGDSWRGYSPRSCIVRTPDSDLSFRGCLTKSERRRKSRSSLQENEEEREIRRLQLLLEDERRKRLLVEHKYLNLDAQRQEELLQHAVSEEILQSRLRVTSNRISRQVQQLHGVSLGVEPRYPMENNSDFLGFRGHLSSSFHYSALSPEVSPTLLPREGGDVSSSQTCSNLEDSVVCDS